MDKLFKTTLLISTIIALLLLSWVLTKVGQPQVCINSSVVEFIDIGSSVLRVGECSFMSKSEVPLKFKSMSDRVNAAAESIEGILRSTQIGVRLSPIQIHLRLDRPYFLNVGVRHVRIGRDLFDSPGYLEKSLLESVLLQNAGPGFASSLVSREIVTDFITQIIAGELNIVEPASERSTQKFLEFENHKLKSFYNMYALCHSQWKPGFLTENCSENEDSNDSKITVWSLRPLLALLLRAELTELSLHEKNKLVQDLFAKLKYQNWSDLPQTDVENVSEMLTNVRVWAQFLGLNPRALDELEQTITKPDLLIVQKKSDAEFEQNLAKHISFVPQQIFTQSGSRLSFYPSGPQLNLGHFTLQPHHLILRSAENVKVSFLKSLNSQDDRVLQILDPNPTIDVLSYLKEGSQGWIATNLKVPFRIFHLPSLRLASQWGLTPQTAFLISDVSQGLSHPLRRLMGLEHPTFIAKANVNYVPGPLSVIEWYR
jgi:hypothetical protein